MKLLLLRLLHSRDDRDFFTGCTWSLSSRIVEKSDWTETVVFGIANCLGLTSLSSKTCNVCVGTILVDST